MYWWGNEVRKKLLNITSGIFTGNRCEVIDAPRNGMLDIRSDYSDEMVDGLKSYDVGTTIEILCDEGAELRGESILTCEFPGINLLQSTSINLLQL